MALDTLEGAVEYGSYSGHCWQLEFCFSVYFSKQGAIGSRSGIGGGKSQHPLPNPSWVQGDTWTLAFTGGLALWPDGRVSILTEVEDSKRLRLLEQVGFPVM